MIYMLMWTVLRVSDPPIMRFAAGGYTVYIYRYTACMYACTLYTSHIFVIISLYPYLYII